MSIPIPIQTTPTWWETDERLDHKGAAAFMGLTPGSFSSAISRGRYQVKRYRVGKKYWYRKTDLLATIESGGPDE